MPNTSHTISPVCPVSAHDLLINRGGRLLLDVPSIEFGAQLDQGVSGQCAVIVGPNGAGKSLLVRILCRLLEPDTGHVLWGGRQADKVRRHRVGLMLQKPVLLRRSALANLVYALRCLGRGRHTASDLGQQALSQAGLEAIAEVPAHQLSGGEQQRLALVRALLLNPDILFLDEATANVDPSSTLNIEQQLQQAKQEGLNVVMVSHDQGQVKRLADEVVLMNKGRVIEHATRERFFEQPENPLTKRWINGELLV